MLGYIEGVVIHKEEKMLIVSVHGVGYNIFGTSAMIAREEIGGHISAWTHLAVKDDALELYGFTEREELGFFRLLIGISGIGPKSALNILSLADVRTIARAIATKDSSYLTRVSGIGKRLAEKIILELEGKIGQYAGDEPVIATETEAVDALEALGYPPKNTRETVRDLAKEHATTQEVIRRALQVLGGRS